MLRPLYDERPLKRVIQQELQNTLAEKILKGEIKEGSSIKVSAKCDEFIVV